MTRLLRAFCLFCIAASLARPGPARAQGAAQVRFNPAAGQVALNQTLAVTVEVAEVADLYGVDLTVTFDPAIVEVVDAYPAQSGVQVAQGTFLDPGFAIFNEADNNAGVVRFAMTQLNPSPAKSGAGALIVITLRGKKANALSALILADAQLASRAGTSIAAVGSNGQIQVLAEPGPGATNTPVPTAGSGVIYSGSATESGSAPTLAPATTAPPAPTMTTAPGQPSLTPAPLALSATPQPTTAGGAAPSLTPAQATAAQPAAATSDSGGAAGGPTAEPGGEQGAGQPGATATPRVMAMLPTRTEMIPTEQSGGRTPPPVDAGEGGPNPAGSPPAGNGLALLTGAAAVILAGLILFSIRRRGARR